MAAFLAVVMAMSQDISSPLTPEAAQREFRIDAGLRVDLVACEPAIESPVSMAFDENGRLYVVEMLDYPTADLSKPPLGRVKLLEDKDGDGRYESAKVFASRLLMCNGVLPWKGGVIVTAAGQILYLKDTDGDGQSDLRDVLFEGFATGNPQLRVSQPTLGIDGWVYVANGLRGGKIKSPKPDSKVVDINGMDFRFNMITGAYEAVSGMGQFGLTFDDWGNRFVCTNRNHLVHIPMEARYFARNPHLAAPPPVRDNNSAGGSARVFPISKNKTLAASHAGTFTASCGVTIYRGDALPEEYRGNAFTCEPTANIVHREILTPVGATFVGKPAYADREFLASRDGWFRPVNLAHGPDGALYVVDMYRPEVEHPEWVPKDQQYRYDFDGPKNHGRIWRIVPEKYDARWPRVELTKTSAKELVELLESPNAWWRMAGHRLVLESSEHYSAELRSLLEKAKSPLARYHAAMLGGDHLVFDGSLSVRLLRDPHSRLRELGIRMSEPAMSNGGGFSDLLLPLADDPDPRVRYQLALSFGGTPEVDWNEQLDAMAKIAEVGADDRWTRLAVASALKSKTAGLLERVKATSVLRELAAVIGSRRDAAELERALKRASALEAAPQRAVLLGLAEGLSRRGGKLSDVLSDNEHALGMLRRASEAAADAARPDAERVEATRLLAHSAWKDVSGTLERLISDPSAELRMAAIGALASHRQPEVAPILMNGWSRQPPAVRREILEAMARETDRCQALLAEVEAGRLSAGEMGTVTQRLANHKDGAVREKAKRLLATRPEDRLKLIETYKPALTAAGDKAKGRAVFEKNCGSCHRVAGVGHHIGPDISDTLSKSKEVLLADILDPSRAIDANYVNYLVRKKNGDIVTGFIAEQNASSVTLRRGADQQDVVLRQDIEEMKSSGLSVMPEGVEKGVTVAEMADLLAFLKHWRD